MNTKVYKYVRMFVTPSLENDWTDLNEILYTDGL